MDKSQALRAVESLRKGIPPDGYIRQFTVGRKNEIQDLTKRLEIDDATVLLLKANYGSGKTHLLKFICEEALAKNYAVSTVSIDSKSAVRFNRMDQILGAVCRNIQTPQSCGQKGIRCLFELFATSISSGPYTEEWKSITNNGKWDYSEELDSKALFVALRAWYLGQQDLKEYVEDWLYNPWNYKGQRALYVKLIEQQYRLYRDPRSAWKFYEDNVFLFYSNGYEQSWAFLRDLDRLAKISGLNGLILQFDEFEDVITNLGNISYQEAAFWNLFRFYNGKSFPGKTFFAVTPEFSDKCKRALLLKEKYNFDNSMFDVLPVYEMSNLSVSDLENLAMVIFDVHGKAYDWEPDLYMLKSQLDTIVRCAASLPVQDRVRNVITTVVKALDSILQEIE